METIPKQHYRVVIIGAGFAGTILAHQLLKYTNAELLMFERCEDIGDSGTGTGLNLNPNGMEALRALDPSLEAKLRACGLPRTKMHAEGMDGTPVYDEPIYTDEGLGLAGYSGLRIRWKDAYTAMRESLPIQYNHALIDFWSDSQKQRGSICIEVEDRSAGDRRIVKDIDFLIATDGRYSRVREKLSPPKTTYIGVSNFRLLVPDTSGGLFDDMELIYNATPESSPIRALSGCPDFRYCLNTLPRIGIMKMPKAESSETMLYIFGNFGIADDIPPLARSKDGLLSLYSAKGQNVSAKGRYILNTLAKYSDKLHWARMQYTNPFFGDMKQNVALLGDAAHAIVPTLGQGATLAIEDACVASKILVEAIQQYTLDATVAQNIQDERLARRIFVENVSLEASQHLMYRISDPNTLLMRESNCWTDERFGFRKKIRKVWREGPVISPMPHTQWRKQM